LAYGKFSARLLLEKPGNNKGDETRDEVDAADE
jgi:hypothetical protein